MKTPPQPPTVPGSQSRWEEAFLRFESPEEERAKFLERLKSLGADAWPRDAAVVDIFCGRGQNLLVLEALGFSRLEGVDLSANLLDRYRGPAKMILADCRNLPFEDSSRDILIVQGGMHHLPSLPGDLVMTLDSVRRVLRPGGRFAVVEPWRTPYLKAVHWLTSQPLARRLWGKLDAFETMYEEEKATYEAWLNHGPATLALLEERFETDLLKISRGKLNFVGRPRK
jgi:SAM-dependent methyltransferase